jgi:hypothetical protein
MNFKSKYIIIDALVSDTPIVFSEILTHADVARAMGGKVKSAGFCYIQNNQYVCYGESISLKVQSRGADDSKILNLLLGASNES